MKMNYWKNSWKDSKDTKTILISKNVNSDKPNKIPFKPNPINHYRKQYQSTSKTFNNSNVIGIFDKPGNFITSNLENTECSNPSTCSSSLKLYVNKNYLKNGINYDGSSNIVCTQSLIIKPSTTVLDKNYSTTNKELLYKKCKTFNQNLPLNDISNNYCTNDISNSLCYSKHITYNPSNTRYQVQGPITSSAKIVALKYGCNKIKDGKPINSCKLRTYDLSNNVLINANNNNPACIGNKNCNIIIDKKYTGGSRIKILK
tara:strand:+ start:1076 stop:1852 length:777 start_codon:yes stop_codon:yes gene_type:complete